MVYKVVVENFTPIDDNHCTIETLSEETMSLAVALEKLRSFAMRHPNGCLISSEHLAEYETDGAELSCRIDYDD